MELINIITHTYEYYQYHGISRKSDRIYLYSCYIKAELINFTQRLALLTRKTHETQIITIITTIPTMKIMLTTYTTQIKVVRHIAQGEEPLQLQQRDVLWMTAIWGEPQPGVEHGIN